MRLRTTILALPLLAGCVSSLQSQSDTTGRITPVPRPDTLRGLYVNRWTVLGPKIWDLVNVAKTTEVNALVFDIKDDRGYVLYRSSVALAREIASDTINPVSPARLREVLDSLRAFGVFPIARIVVAKDPLLARAKPGWSVHRKDNGEPWLDANNQPWLDPHHREVWAYAADLAQEAVALGFGEVQFDYVRFPDDPRMAKESVFPLAKGRSRAQVIHEQLGYLHDRVEKTMHVPMSIDVFGLTTTDQTDMGIGQKWEAFASQTDIVQPMTYPSHYSEGWYGLPNPNADPYELISHAMTDAKKRNASIKHRPKIVPWYQDFTLGKPAYGIDQVRAQMQAGYDNGIMSWLLWNAGSDYTVAALHIKGSQ
jgi:hypothetical protein